MNKLLQSLLRRHRPDVDALSAHLDGRLAAREVETLDAHISSCAACSSAIEGLRLVRTELRAMPEVTHPRSFRLRGADVARAPVRFGGGARGQALRLMPVLSGVAAVVFVVALGADLMSGGSSSLKSADTTAMSAARQEAAAAGNYAPSREPAADSALTTRSTTAVPPVAGAYIGEPTVGADAMAPDVAATPAAPGSALAPESGTPLGTEGTSGNKSTIPSPTPELSAASRRPNSSGDVDGLRVVEVVAAVVAVVAAAAAAAVGWRNRSRGERP